MELLMILTYTAICVAVFKIFRIPVNKWTLPTAALGGIFLITGILLIMNYNHPFTKNARIYFAATPVMPNVKGRVIEVAVGVIVMGTGLAWLYRTYKRAASSFSQTAPSLANFAPSIPHHLQFCLSSPFAGD